MYVGLLLSGLGVPKCSVKSSFELILWWFQFLHHTVPQNEGYEAQFRFIHQKSDNRQNFDCLRYCECHSIDKKG